VNFFTGAAPISIRLRLILFTVALLLPALLITLLSLQQGYKRERAAFEDGLRSTARAAALALDNQIGQGDAVLRTLATSAYLDTGDLEGFYRQARAAVGGDDRWVVLLDATSKQQLVNTRQPWGAALPRTPWRDIGVTATEPPEGRVVVSNLFKGTVAQQPVFFMNIRLTRGGRPYDLGITMLASSLDPLLASQKMPPGWIGTVLDQNGAVVTRTIDAARFVGARATPDVMAAIQRANEGVFDSRSLDGTPTVLAFSRAPAYGWTFIIAVPQAEVTDAARRRIALFAAASLVLLALGVLVAMLLGRSIAAPIERLKDQAAALGRGEAAHPVPGPLREANDVASVLATAGDRLAEGKRELTEALHRTERQSEVLRRTAAEKDVLLREVHHRVKNNLAMIAGLVRIAGQRAPQDAQPVLKDISRRIVTVGQIYTQVHEADDLRRVDLAKYVRAICENTAGSVGGDHIAIDMALEPCTADIDTAIPLGLILGELLTNAYKHAFPGERGGRIFVGLARHGERGALTVEDDGIGLSEIRRAGASGLGLANALAPQIDGMLEIKNAPGTGAHFKIAFALVRTET
jgi:two-component sensor histidine kinase